MKVFRVGDSFFMNKGRTCAIDVSVVFGIAVYELERVDGSQTTFRHCGMVEDMKDAVRWLKGKKPKIIRVY